MDQSRMWTPSKDVKYGVAIYRFRGKDAILSKCLPLEIGETVQILERCGGWYRGFSTKNKNLKGIFPARYVQPKDATVCNEGPYESAVPVTDAMVNEVAYVLNEWLTRWKKHYVHMDQVLFRKVREDMNYLIKWRKQLVSGTLTHEQSSELKAKISKKIDLGNVALGLDLVPRLEHEEVDPELVSVSKLFKLHQDGTEASKHQNKSFMQRKNQSSHLFFLLRNFPYTMGEEMEIYFGLYNVKHSSYISEKFLVRHHANDESTHTFDRDRRESRSAVFTDMGCQTDFKDLYIVAQIFRKGAMLVEDGGKTNTKKKTNYSYKRPFGCAVLSINDVQLNQFSDQDKEFHLDIYHGEKSTSETDFAALPDMIIAKEGGRRGFKMAIAMRLLYGDLETVKRENPIIFTRAAGVCRSLGVADIIRPGDDRNDLYLILRGGDFEKGRKTAAKNVEVKICIVDDRGVVIPNAIEVGKGCPPVTEFVSSVYYHNNNPKWQEMIKINIPMEQFEIAHFRASLRHCSNNRGNTLFGLAYEKLVKNTGATIEDAHHRLAIYKGTPGTKFSDFKCEDISKLNMHDVYLELPSRFDDTPSQSAGLLQRSGKEFLVVQTVLCSTKYTQNVDLLNFLRWRASRETNLANQIEKLKILNGVEIVKFLPDILDALFVMLGLDKNNAQVFQALVHICRLLNKPQFEHFRPVMDNYIEEIFSARLVFRDILKALHQTARSIPTLVDSPSIDEAFQTLMVMKYLFRFTVQSRKLYTRVTTGNTENRYLEMLQTLFREFAAMLGHAYSEETKLQVLLLRDLTSTFDVLLETVTVEDLSFIVCEFIESIPREIPPPIRRQYMKFLRDLISTEIFKREETRRKCLPIILAKVRVISFIEKTEIDIGAQITCDILDFLLSQGKSETVHKNVGLVIVTLMVVVTQTIQRVDRSSQTMTHLITCLIMMFKMMDEHHYESFFTDSSVNKREPMKNFLLMVFNVFEMLVKTDVYSRDWVVMRMITNSVIQETMQYFGQLLTDKFLSDGCFNFQVWDSYFRLAVAFVTQKILQLEKYSHAKREKIVAKYSDMRIPMAVDIQSMWQSLGAHKFKFIPHMVGPFLEVTVVPETELRKATLPIFFDMMECEQRDKGNFKMVESELIDKLDILVSQNKGDDEYKELFQNMLQDRVSAEPEWKESGSAFIKSVTRLLERLLDYRRVMEGETNYSQKMLCTVNLLNFYKTDINREEMYIRYIYKLTALHLKAEYYTEAAFTRLLHAQMLKWTSDMLPTSQDYPAQRAQERKEAIYRRAIEDFDKGKAWEFCFPLCQELVDYYSTIYDYIKLSSLMKLQASFYEKILNELRLDPTYFRLGFYGQPFPSFVKNKTFIFRGGDCERLSELKYRILAEHPYAQVLDRTSEPDESIKSGDIPYIQVYTVKPVPSDRSVLSLPNVSDKISSFYRSNKIDTFQYDRPFYDGERDPNNDFKTLCLERTVMLTSSELPGILKHCEVVDSRTIVLRPIETAIDCMRNMNTELKSLIAEYHDNLSKNCNPLTMRLGGVIDAAVMGGTAKYHEAFLTNEFAFEHPEHATDIGTLRCLIWDQIRILQDGMKIHAQCAPAEVRPLHDKLVVDLKKMTKIMGPSRMSAASSSSECSDPLVMNDSRPISQTSSGNRSVDSGTSGIFSQLDDLEQPPKESEDLVEDFDSRIDEGVSPGSNNTSRKGSAEYSESSPNLHNRSTIPTSPDTPPQLPVSSRRNKPPTTTVFDEPPPKDDAPPPIPAKRFSSSPNIHSHTLDYRTTGQMTPLNEEDLNPPPIPPSMRKDTHRPPLPPRGQSMVAKGPTKQIVPRRRPSVD